MNEITLEHIYQKLEELVELQNIKPEKHESESTNELNTALAKAQSQYPPIYLNRNDKYLNSAYTDLDNILRLIRPILGENGISFTQRTLVPDSGKTFLQTQIWHSSSQWMDTVERFKPAMNNLDAYHSEMSELRKSQITGLLGITICNDMFDDNGYDASETQRKIDAEPTNEDFTYKPKRESFETISKDQATQIERELAFIPGFKARLLIKLHLRSLADIPKTQYEAVLETVRNNKEAVLNKR